MFLKSTKFLFPLLALIAVGFFAFAQEKDGESKAEGEAGKSAPEFKAKTLDDKEIDFPKQYKDKVVLLDFWATWCPPCRGEIPHLKEAYEQFHEKGLVMIGISLDASRNISAEKVTEFTKSKEMPWAQIYKDADAIAMSYGIQSIPSAFLVDGATGKLLASGRELRGKRLLKVIEANLPKDEPASDSGSEEKADQGSEDK